VIAALIATATTTALAAGFAGPAQAAHAATYYRLVQYPAAGFGGLDHQIRAAKHSIDMEIYELEDATVEHDLAQAAARGVTVRVLLDRDFAGAKANATAYGYLAAHHVQVRWAPSHYIFHIKTTTFDAHTSDISTANLTPQYYATTRDATVIDTNPAQVSAIQRTFANDWNSGAAGMPRNETVQAAGLVWSPNTGTGSAETAMVDQIDAAHTSIEFESEELSDSAVYDALAADARRGVSCEIVMTNSSEWRTAFAAVSTAGCRVRVFPDSEHALYIHEKLVLDDHGTSRQSLLIGSQNASWTSLHENRELGVRIDNRNGGIAVINSVNHTFGSDYAHASKWTPAVLQQPTTPTLTKPAPTSTTPKPPTPASTGASCHPVTDGGNCYEPGEYCRDDDHGAHGVAGDGKSITCEDDDGWRWVAT
jgi:cardiolipin synthase A/B